MSDDPVNVDQPDDDGHCGHCQPWDCFSLDPLRHTDGLGLFWDDDCCPRNHKEAPDA